MRNGTSTPSSAVFLTAVFFFFSLHSTGTVVAQPSPVTPTPDDRLLVAVGGDRTVAEEMLRTRGAIRVDALSDGRTYRVFFPPETDLAAAAAMLRQEPAVVFAEMDVAVELHAVPDDPLFPDLWNFQNDGQGGGAVGADIDLPAAWDLSTGSPDVIVGLIDTGVAWDHPDLAANIWVNRLEAEGLAGVDDDGNGYVDDIHGIDVRDHDSDPLDELGHGSHVAGIIGASGNNGVGVTGINWNVKILPCKFTDRFGGGNVSDTIECMAYLRALKDRGENIVAVNNSWGWFGEDPLQSVYDAMASLDDMLLVASAGNNAWDNSGPQKAWPAAYDLPNLLVVGATDANDLPWSVSNYGPFVDVSAPGVNILSTLSPVSNWGGGLYGPQSGTSMAAPHATGIAALVAGAEGIADWRILRNRVLSGAEETGTLADSNLTGRRVSAYGALACSGAPLLRVSEAPPDNGPEQVGQTRLLEAISIECGDAAGPVQMTAGGVPGAAVLRDDGFSPDAVAGDGVFSALWTPSEVFGDLHFSSPAGEVVIPAVHPVITSTTLPPAVAGRAYSSFIEAQGATDPCSWSVVAGMLPEGLALDAATGEVYGTPLGAGTSFTLHLSDAAGEAHSRDLAIDVLDEAPIRIRRARYKVWREVLRIVVDSPLGAAASPIVAGYGPMTWKPERGFWKLRVRHLAAADVPDTVTVTDGGFSVTAPVRVVERR